MRWLKLLYLAGLLLAVLLVDLQTVKRYRPDTLLTGFEEPTPPASPSLSGLMNGTVQRSMEKFVSAKIGFRGYAIKFDNQIGFSLFREISSSYANRIVLGKNNQLFEYTYILVYDRRNGTPPENIENKIRQMKRLQELLASRGISFLFLITPGKGSVMKEHIPSKFLLPGRESRISNYATTVRLLQKYSINNFDALSYFNSRKTTSSYPLFCRGGTHWSMLAQFYFFQDIQPIIAGFMRKDLVRVKLKQVTVSAKPTFPDNDIQLLTNILFDSPLTEVEYHYPVVDPDPQWDLRFKPRVLEIGGSFMRNLNFLMDKCRWYQKRSLYYYNNTEDRYPQGTSLPLIKNRNTLSRVIDETDLIIIEANESCLADIGFGFIQEAIAALENAPARP